MKEIDLSLYFEPCPYMEAANFYRDDSFRLGRVVEKYTVKEHFPSLEGVRVAIVGVSESRGGDAASEAGPCNGADTVRKSFYNLFPPKDMPKTVDLGNLRQGQTMEDTYFALAEVLHYAVSRGVAVLILGGTQDLTYAAYKAFARLGRACNLLSVDSRLNFSEEILPGQTIGSLPMNHHTYMSRIAVEPGNYLFDFLNIGYQTYLVDSDCLSLMDRLTFDVCRLGEIRGNIEAAEPFVRDADCLSFDFSVLKRGESPANPYAMPTGLTAEEVCQVMRYAGLTHGLDIVGLFEFYPALDRDSLSANLMAEMMWCFIDGMRNRIDDHPYSEDSAAGSPAPVREVDFKEYLVPLEDMERELVFCKCRQSDRWWMKLPCTDEQRQHYGRRSYIACSYADYQLAMQSEIPQRWWRALQRLR